MGEAMEAAVGAPAWLIMVAAACAAAFLGAWIGAARRGGGSDRLGRGSARALAAAPRSGGAGETEGDAVLDLFETRFGVETRTADAVGDYLDDVAGAIDRLRGRAEEAEARAEALDEALRLRADAESEQLADGWAAGGRVALEGADLARAAAAAFGRDADFEAFADAVGLDDALRDLAALASGDDRVLSLRSDAVDDAWPHDLWRAEALLAAYYPAHGYWPDLRDGVAAAAQGVRHLLRLQGVAVAHAPILRRFDPNDGERWTSEPGALMDLEPPRRLIAARAAGGETGFVVDCETFGFADEGRRMTMRSRLVVYGA